MIMRQSRLAMGLGGLLALGAFLGWRSIAGHSHNQATGSPAPSFGASAGPRPSEPPESAALLSTRIGDRRSAADPARADEGKRVTRSQVPPLTESGKAAIRQGKSALAREDLSAATAAFARAVATDPMAPLTHDFLGIAYLRGHRYDAALAQFREEIRLSPDPSTGLARTADVWYARQNIKEAIHALEQAVALRPDVAQLHYNLGMLYPQALELNKAVESLGRYCSMESDNHYARYLRGSLLFKLALLDDAESDLNEALRLAPDVGLYHAELAKVYFRRTASPETTGRAIAELQKALDDRAPEPAAVQYYLGLCYQRQGNSEAARRAFQTSVQQAPEAWGAYYALAEVLQKLGRPEEARKARVRFALLRAKEDLRMQRSFYEQEVGRNPDRADAYYQLAAFLARHSDPEGAGTALARALSLAKNHDSAKLRQIAALGAELRRSRVR